MALEKEDRPQSISAWLGLLETPQPPPPVAPQYRKEEIKPISYPSNKNVRPVRLRARKIPWISLITSFVLYSIYGAIMAIILSPLWVVALALAFVSVLSLALALALALAFASENLKEENFSPLPQFLILSGVSSSGLGLGYLIGVLIR